MRRQNATARHLMGATHSASRSRIGRGVWAAVIGTALITGLAIAGGAWIDNRGVAFFQTGQAVVVHLDRIARAVKAGDASALTAALAARFEGTDLGPSSWTLVETRDAVRRYRWLSTGRKVRRDDAVSSWLTYAATFEHVQEMALHLETIEAWRPEGPIAAVVRFETIGTPLDETQAGIDRARFRVRFDRTSKGLEVVSASLIDGERILSTQPAFRDVANAAGVDFANRYYPLFLSEPLAFGMIRHGPGGITTADVDNDGFYDLFVPDGVASRLFRNRGDGTFEDVTDRSGLGGLDGVSTAVFADYDNDGHKDAFISRTFEPNQLFHNNRDGSFTDVTKRSGLGADCCATAASWTDYDLDGLLDLYVGRYLDPRTTIPTTPFYARNGEPNQLYHNNGDGTFTNVSERAGVDDPGLCLATVAGDYDDDGYPDLFVVNDFGRSTLYHNERSGRFTDVTVAAGTLAYGAGMNATIGDYDNDGRLDLYTTDIRSEHAWFAEPPTFKRYMANSLRQGVWMSDMPLYFEMFKQSGFGLVGVFKEMAIGNHLLRNRGDGTFEDVSVRAGANPFGWFWGASLADFDNDGWQDLYAATGWVYNDPGTELELEFLNNAVGRQDEYKTGHLFNPANFGRRSWHGYERNRYLRNNGNGTFTEMGRAKGVDLLLNSRGVAVADFWNRGRIDIAVSASGDRHALLKNVGTSGHWLGVELVGTRSNRDGVGARVRVRTGDAWQMREVVLGDGYGSQNTLRLHFGLGDRSTVDELVVSWPRSGLRQVFRQVTADRILEVTEGRDEFVEKKYRAGAP